VNFTTRDYRTAGSFLEACGEALSAQEAVNNLPLGLCIRLMNTEGPPGPPPFFHTTHADGRLAGAAMMTPPHNIILCSGPPWPDGAMSALVDDLLAGGMRIPGVIGPSALADRFASAWKSTLGPFGAVEVEPALRLGLFTCSKVAAVTGSRGSLRRADAGDLELVVGWTSSFHLDCFGEVPEYVTMENTRSMLERGDVFLWMVDGMPVSMAARSRPTWHGVTVSMVYTPPRLRRAGHATGCVAALTRLLLSAGMEFCTLFTDLANPTSNHVYESIGYRRIGEFAEYRFRT
jgi:ribosomal protein S18 acetylase RimI-like enzyme